MCASPEGCRLMCASPLPPRVLTYTFPLGSASIFQGREVRRSSSLFIAANLKYLVVNGHVLPPRRSTFQWVLPSSRCFRFIVSGECARPHQSFSFSFTSLLRPPTCRLPGWRARSWSALTVVFGVDCVPGPIKLRHYSLVGSHGPANAGPGSRASLASAPFPGSRSRSSRRGQR